MAKCGITNISGGGGIGSDELSVTKEYVLSGKTYVGADTNDEIGTGTMANNGTTANQSFNASGSFLVKKGYHAQDFSVIANSLASQTSGTAISSQIINGQTAWVNGSKFTGTLSVNSILSFSAAAYSTTQILLQWQNPYAATGRPLSGVFINYSTGGYPGTGGTRIYTGYGSNSTPGGISQAIVTMPSIGTTYYFSATNYASATPADLWGTTLNAVAATTSRGQQAFTSSTIFTIPAGVRSIDLFCVGGGSGGGSGDGISPANAGGGGAAGYTTTQKAISVTPGQQINIIIGAGGAGGDWINGSGVSNAGGLSKVTINGQDYCIANGGAGTYSSGGKGGTGGGGAGKMVSGSGSQSAGNGGSNGSDGFEGYGYPGIGQKTTTRAFGESSNTLYAGGGGGGGNGQRDNSWRGFGGAGGGGNGSDAMGNAGSSGGAGTGSGGGGGYQYGSKPGGGYYGGSGICLIRWGY